MGIVAAALAIMRSEGRVTMRRLAQELDTGPASLYVYVRDTGDLYADMLDELLGDVDLAPVTASGPWRERLSKVLVSYTLILFDNPELAHSALVSRPSGPNYLSVLEGLLALLRVGEVPDDRAAWGVDNLLLFATGLAAEHGARERRLDADKEHDTLVRALKDADPASYPNIHRVAVKLISGEGVDRMRWAFEMLINGIVETPRR